MIKEVLKYVLSGTVDLLMVISMIIISVLDFTTDLDLTGALAFFTVYTSFAVFRIGYWKWRYTQGLMCPFTQIYANVHSHGC
jgi:hypothetical protein